MPEYLISVWHDGPAEFDAESPDTQRRFAQVDAFNTELQQAGALVFAGGLHPPEASTVVRIANGEVSMTPGPVAESRQHLGGFWVIQAPDLDDARGWAARAAAACEETLEVRPFQGE